MGMENTEKLGDTWVNAKGEVRPLFRRDKEFTQEQNDMDAVVFKTKYPGKGEERKPPSVDISQLCTGISGAYNPRILKEKIKQ